MASDGGIYTCQATLTVVDDVFTFDDYSQVTLTGECASFLFYGTPKAVVIFVGNTFIP